MKTFPYLNQEIRKAFENNLEELAKASGIKGYCLGAPLNEESEYKVPLGFRMPDRSYEGHWIQDGNIHLEQLTSCCGAVLISSLGFAYNIIPQQRVAYATLLFKLIQEGALNSGYSLLMYTTIPKQHAIISALQAQNFLPMQAFGSQRTGNEITIWTKQIANKEGMLNPELIPLPATEAA